MTDTNVPLLGQENKEEETVLELVEAETAFLIYTTPEGNTVLTPDINIPLTVERPPTSHEVKGALHNVLDDFQMQEAAFIAAPLIAQHVLNAQMQAVQQIRQQQLSPQEAQAVAAATRLAK